MLDFLAIPDLYKLPVSSPELKFFIILGIVLFAPLLLDRLRIPHILGLIIAGALVGEHGLNLLERDSGVVLSGTVGLLYIMFLAGLEIDINEFMKNRWRSIIFGLYTFIIPMALGTLVGLYLLDFSMMTSVLLASMFASHTLLAYPIISKLGIKRNRAVTVTIGGTVIAETLALLVLAVVVGMTEGEVNTKFWLTLSAKLFAFCLVVFFVFPPIARRFLKRFSDGLTQYVFILFMLFMGSIFAMLAGIEGIIGALFTGLALNRLIPNSSALMNRIEFVGNAIFIPFFLIGVGMLIDYRVFLSDPNTLYTAFIMTVIAIVSKYVAAYITQKSFGYSSDERSVIFGLSGARAAATLAVVLVGYNIILGVDDAGEPIRLLSSSVLNGTIVMIFVTCSVASIEAQRGAYKISMREALDLDEDEEDELDAPTLLLPFNDVEGVEDLVSLTHALAPTKSSITVASVISDAKDERAQISQTKKVFELAHKSASSHDRKILTVQRYDASYTNGISNIIREHNVSDLLMNLSSDKELSAKVISKITNTSVRSTSVTTFLYRSQQSINSIRRHLLIIPPNAEMEIGFRAWITRLWTLFRKTGVEVVIYASSESLKVIDRLNEAAPVPIQTMNFERYSDLLIISKDLRKDDNIIFIMARQMDASYNDTMEQIPYYINNYFARNNFMMIFPYQTGAVRGDLEGMANAASITAVAKIEDVIDSVIGVLKRKS